MKEGQKKKKRTRKNKGRETNSHVSKGPIGQRKGKKTLSMLLRKWLPGDTFQIRTALSMYMNKCLKLNDVYIYPSLADSMTLAKVPNFGYFF